MFCTCGPGLVEAILYNLNVGFEELMFTNEALSLPIPVLSSFSLHPLCLGDGSLGVAVKVHELTLIYQTHSSELWEVEVP